MVISGDALRNPQPAKPTLHASRTTLDEHSPSRILVTGGHGFLGSAVRRKLEHAGYCVITPTSIEYDLRSEGLTVLMVEATKPDCIIHCAARCGGIGANVGTEAEFMQDNLRMGLNVLSASRYSDSCRVIIIGSVCAYPENCPQPMKESDLWSGWPEPTNAYYGIAKRTVMAAADAYRKQYALSTLNLVLTNLYGPGDNFDLKTSHVVPAIIRKMSESPNNGTVCLWGDGTPTRDLLYVEDAADAIMQAVQHPEVTGTINIATGWSHSIAKIADMISGLMEWTGSIQWDTTKPNGQRKRILDTTKAADLLGWRAGTSLSVGLKSTIESFLED